MFHDLPLKAVIAHIETHLDSSLEVEDLARLTGYAEGYFRRVFLAATGSTPAMYVRRRRISHAAFLLRNTSHTVTEIALCCGFASSDAFTRAFRHLAGQNPVAFRHSNRVVKGVAIIPGLLAPVLIDIQNEEEDPMSNKRNSTSGNKINDTSIYKTKNPPSKATNRTKNHSTMATHDANASPGGSVVLYGVPRVSYFNDPPELTPFISSLRACLTFSGQSMPYDRLMVASGAAFRLLWNTSCLDGGNVDILAMRPDPYEPIHRAFAAAGRTFRLLQKADAPGNRDDMISLLREEMDAGRPVIAFGIVGPPEACVLTGYQENGDVVLGWNYFQDFPEWQGSIGKHEAGYFVRRGWYEHPETLGIMAVGPAGSEPDEKSFLADVVRFALTVMNGPAVGDRANGDKAFEAWESMLRDDKQFPKNAPLPMLMERLMVQGDAFTMVAEGRAYAGSFFMEEAKRFPELANQLMEISGLCRRIHEKAWEMIPLTGGMGMGEAQAQSLAIRENRLAVADRVKACRELDRKLARLLEELGSALTH